MTKEQAYDALDRNRVHWGRKDYKHIYVWTSGYMSQDSHEIEKYLMQAGMRRISIEFDKIGGKTRCVYKHK